MRIIHALLPLSLMLSFLVFSSESKAQSPDPSLACESYTFEKVSKGVLKEELEEMSGLLVSREDADVLIHVRDSGNDATLVFSKRDGTVIASYPFADKAADPEELDRGECPWGGSCIFVFDTGDNFRWRTKRSIFVVEESSLKTGKPRVEKIDFTFPKDEKLDVEAVVVIDKTFYFFAKEPKHSRVFSLDFSVMKGGPSEAKYVTDLPYTMITGAAATDDGSRIILLSWQGVVELSREAPGIKAKDSWYPYRRRFKIKGLAQQEAITYDRDQRSFLYSSEKKMFSNQEWGIMHA
ncbi:MAG: hypothetical protein EOP07_05305, partial [Proteobacteria bacterium]